MFFQKENIWDKWSHITPKTTFLLACSGGKDSMALFHFLLQKQCHFAVAHCNFGLRGAESDGDELFVKNYCLENKILFYNIHFDTTKYASERKIGIQEAARDLRYNWLAQLREENNFNYILTAHHLNDQAETILFHLAKGTGIKGLVGMEQIKGTLLRPLLETSVKEIIDYIQKNKVPYREDNSNSSEKYSRNFIRLKIIPDLEQINPKFIESISNFSQRMAENVHLVKLQADKIWQKQAKVEKDTIRLAIGLIKNHFSRRTLLFYWFDQYGFNTQQIKDIESAIVLSKNGLQFTSNTHTIFIEKNHVFISKRNCRETSFTLFENMPKQITFNEIKIKISILPINELNIKTSEKYAYFDAEKIEFPLKMRYLEMGDYFYPFGMTKHKSPEKLGKKKVSKYFKDIKLQNVNRLQTPILLSGNKIIWVVGHRIDGRFAINKQTNSVIKMVIVDAK